MKPSRSVDELGDGDWPEDSPGHLPRPRYVRFRSKSDVYEAEVYGAEDEGQGGSSQPSPSRPKGSPAAPDYTVSLKPCQEPSPMKEPAGRGVARRPPYVALLLLVAAFVSFAHNSPLLAAPLRRLAAEGGAVDRHSWQRRDAGDDPTSYCTRWSQQTAIVNGTLFSYGGRASQSPGQTDNTWNNDFLTLDLTKSWDAGTPLLSGLPQPSGPPPVANGYMWYSYSSLFLYGGEYSDTPIATPSPFALWEYDIASASWTSHSDPKTTAGNNSDPGNQPVQDSAEGAGITVAQLGRGWYFGGHQDYLTTAGWSNQVARIYLKSLVEFTFPGYTNDGVDGLADTPAGSGGAWRNITQGGIQTGDGFTERADGVLVYVPGYGDQGIILGLAGGTNTTFTEMNVIDVMDVATSTWYKQSTQGGPPPIRVNPCAVAASAADGSSTNIYMYGGQNLQPYKNQTQYGDMWILTVPSFTWIQVDDSDGAPPPRAGHSCEIWDGQMVVFGGYVGTQISCDSPGIYVYNLSSLAWQTSFKALSGGDSQSQQQSQEGSKVALAGSYGYSVPDKVQSVIGGAGGGGATITSPVAGATGGPLATGSPLTFTAAVSGAVITSTAAASSSNGGASGPNIAAIVAGTIAGVLFVVACYLGFCVYVYRKQLKLYKNHVSLAQRAAIAPQNEKAAFPLSNGSSTNPSSNPAASTAAGSQPSANTGRSGALGATVATEPGTEALQRRYSDAASSTEHLEYQEPSFMGVLMRPRRSLRIVNRD